MIPNIPCAVTFDATLEIPASSPLVQHDLDMLLLRIEDALSVALLELVGTEGCIIIHEVRLLPGPDDGCSITLVH